MILIVNIASYCNYTNQLVELNALHRNYQFLEVLAFPTRQFGREEPAANGTEVMNEMVHVRPGHNFKPHFHLFNIVDVNGADEHPLFKFLKSMCVSTRDEFADVRELYYKPLRSSDIRWNFEKFLINQHGHPIIRYDREARIGDIKKDIEITYEY